MIENIDLNKEMAHEPLESLYKRRVFIGRLRRLGFDGPISGIYHQLMGYEHHRLAIPSNSEYSIPQLRMMIQEEENIIGRNINVKK